MMGNVAKNDHTPPAEIGARLPNQRTSNGAKSKVIISRVILDYNAMVPNSGPLYSVIKILDRE